MRSWPLFVLATTLIASPVTAQDPDDAPQRTALRERIERTFVARAREEMSLTDEQASKLLEVSRRTADRRRDLEVANRRLNALLASEMRPGVAGDARVLRRALDSLVTIRVAAAEVYRDEQRELSAFLTDVQRAQFHVLRERLLDRVERARAERQPTAPPARRRQP